MTARAILTLLAAAALALAGGRPVPAGTRGADELFWVPTVEQALEMAGRTGRPIFMLFYTCVGETSETYSGKSTVW
jgi:hypothetical protein